MKTLVALTLGIALAEPCFALPICDGGRGKRCVVDGDTLIMDGAMMRLARIDAPETWDAHCDAEARRGWITARRLAKLLTGEFDVSPTGQHAPDGRPLVVVTKDDKSVGDILVQERLARRWYGDYETWC